MFIKSVTDHTGRQANVYRLEVFGNYRYFNPGLGTDVEIGKKSKKERFRDPLHKIIGLRKEGKREILRV
jgi:hypothetical protein